MTQERDKMSKAERLAEALIEETLAMSDEELLAEAAEAGEDVGEVEKALRVEIASVVSAHRHKQLLAAKAAVAAQKLAPKGKQRPKSVARSAITRAVSKQASADAPLTLAARDGRNVPDADLEGLAEDLSELGFDLDGEDPSDAG